MAIDTQKVLKGVATNLKPNTWTKPGLMFIGWSDSASNPTVKYKDGEKVAFNSDTKLYAVWSALASIATFYHNDGTGASTVITQDFGEVLTPPTLSKTGYTYVWNPTVPSTMPAEDASYQAQWTANTYYVRFNPNNGIGSMGDQTFTYDVEQNLRANSFTRTGYTYQGWAESSTGSKKYDNQQRVKNLTSTNGGVINLYAFWQINKYKATFNGNGGTPETTIKEQDYNTDLSAPTVTRTGHTFLHWNPTVPQKMPAGDTTYNAQWQINQYTATFDANGGQGGTSVTQDYGTALTAPTVTWEGYIFSGWNPEVPTTMPAESKTYTAQWSNEQCTVTLDKQNGSGGSSSVIATYNFDMPLATMPTRDGYQFGGYYTTVNGGGTQYYTQSGTSARKWNIASSTYTLYAKWTANNYTVIFNANGGSVSPTSKSVTYDSTYGDLPTPTYEGHTFRGWYTETSSGTQISTSTKVTITDTQTLYARWRVNSYVITYNPGANGSGAQQTDIKTHGETLTLKGSIFTRTGYTQIGWAKSDGGTMEYAPGASYTTNEPITLYPFWMVNSYTVTFKDYDGTILKTQTVTYGNPATAPTNPTRTGYWFAGWDTDFSSITRNTIVTAQWTERYVVTEDENYDVGVSGYGDNVLLNYD